jgi:hypothetical protein
LSIQHERYALLNVCKHQIENQEHKLIGPRMCFPFPREETIRKSEEQRGRSDEGEEAKNRHGCQSLL